MANSYDNRSDSLFSDEEPSSETGTSPMIPATQRPMESEVEEGNSPCDTPYRPLNATGTRQRLPLRKRPLISDGDSSDEEPEASDGKEGLQEIKGLLQLLFKKVEKNERVLTELQGTQRMRFV